LKELISRPHHAIAIKPKFEYKKEYFMERRKLLTTLAQGGVAATTVGVMGGCNTAPSSTGTASDSLPTIEWQMATSWPVSLDTLFGGAKLFAERVAALTGNRFKITPRAAGELAPGLEVLNVVSQGAVPCGHTASYYYVGKSTVMGFGSSLPFGFNAQQQNAWLYEGGGLKQLQELYASKFNLIQFPAGKLGVTVQTLPGGEIFQALQTGAIDAAEWVGPYDDEKLGLNKVAQFYYYPGWWEPGTTLEVQINLDEWKKLPPEYQAVIQTAANEVNMTTLSRYESQNNEALQRLIQGGVQLRQYSDEIMKAAEQASFALYNEFAAQDADFKAVFDQWQQFRNRVYAWNKLNEGSFEQFTYTQLQS
jgi:TRAP-type mannitol/chloroaromatic compound transport system substrate-binding protein